MAPLCKLAKRGAVRANELPLTNDLEAWPNSSVGRAPTYNVRGREFESRSGRLFFHTFTFHFFQILLPLQKSFRIIVFAHTGWLFSYCIAFIRDARGNVLVYSVRYSLCIASCIPSFTQARKFINYTTFLSSRNAVLFSRW